MVRREQNGIAKFVGVIVAVTLAAAGAVFAYGQLSKDVERNSDELQRKADRATLEQYQQTNERDHQRMQRLLETILREVRHAR